MFLSKYGVALLATCVLSSPVVACQHGGRREAELFVNGNRGPEFAFKMFSIPVLIEWLDDAKASEAKTGINLGRVVDGGRRAPLEKVSLDPDALLDMGRRDAKNAIFDFTVKFLTVYFAVESLWRNDEVRRGSPVASLYERASHEGLAAFRDFLGRSDAQFHQYKGKGNDDDILDAAGELFDRINDSVNDKEKFFEYAEKDRKWDRAHR
jgi:hypothetical protein